MWVRVGGARTNYAATRQALVSEGTAQLRLRRCLSAAPLTIAARVRITVPDADHWAQRFAAALAGRGMFVPSDTPPPLNSTVELVFVDRAGTTLSTLRAKVVHSRPALTPGEKTAGMGLEIGTLDAAAQNIVNSFKAAGGRSHVAQDLSDGILVEQLSAGEAPAGSAEGPILGIDLGTTY